MKTWRLYFLTALSLLILSTGPWTRVNAQSPQFTGVQLLTNQEMALTVTAPVGSAYRIEAATNLSTWNAIVTFPTNLITSLRYTDSAAPYLEGRFYRALQLVGTNSLSGDHLSTTNGDVIIHPHQHAAIIFSWDGKIIYIDPKNDVLSYNGQPRGDLVLITHSHSDHFNTATIEAVRSNTAPILCPQAVYNLLTVAQKTSAIILTNGAVTNILGMTVEAVPAYNISNSNHPLGVGNGYVLNLSGRRIYIAGDTEDIPAMRALTNIDVAFVPINRPFTMTVSNAVSAVREFRPGVVYPYHNSPSTPTTDVNLFKQQVGTDLGIEVRLRKWY
jgi:L-ascorbate metabolism protein UlaG (beta-lactamase superfamily)